LYVAKCQIPAPKTGISLMVEASNPPAALK
jgi:hypothetical protein